jgi:hypothetical protein
MKQIIVETARRKRSQKRGAGAIVKWPRFSRPIFARNKLRSGSAGLVCGAAVTAPANQALESALGSHLCVALSSAQVQIL